VRHLLTTSMVTAVREGCLVRPHSGCDASPPQTPLGAGRRGRAGGSRSQGTGAGRAGGSRSQGTGAGRAGGSRSQGYALPTCHAALGWAASTPRGAGFQPAWRRSSLPPLDAGCDCWCAGTNLVQPNVYAQVAYSCLTDSMIETSTSCIPMTRMGNGGPRAGS